MSDIVESTKLIEALGDATYAALFERHDDIVQRLARQHRGRELNRSDGVLMRFHSVAGAANFALEYHAGLAALDGALAARVGIHVGQFELRDRDDARASASSLLPGLAVPMTARVMGLACGGQTLLSAAARYALPHSEHRVASHGFWRMKGVADPIEIFEIGEATKVFVPPEDASKAYCVVQRHGLWLPRRDIPHTLPAERDRFIGREADLTAMARTINGGARFLSIVGTGGVGKTRLVQHYGWQWLGDFDGGVWYCDLAQAVTCDGLLSAVGQGLGVQLGAASAVEQIAKAVTTRGTCLVILDNFEQLTDFAVETLGHWLDAAPDAYFLVTSRTVIGLPGERVQRLDSMGLADGAALFADRAAEVGQREGPASGASRGAADRESETVASLIRLLDGIPLAIELAAARTRIMDVKTLVIRMRERFKLLAHSGSRVARHATLRATLDWSWDLLSMFERSALAQAAVFEGGFDLTAFESVVSLEAGSANVPAAMDVLQSLVEKSLVQRPAPDRFSLLISVQEYAAERLEAGEDGKARVAATQRRHARHFAALDETAATANRSVEVDNLIAAVRRAAAAGDGDTASRALLNAWAAIKQRGPYRVGASLAQDVELLDSLSDASRARTLYVKGSALQGMADTATAKESFAQGLEAARRGQATFEEARLLRARGELELAAGRHADAETWLNSALTAAQATADPLLECNALNALGTLAQTLGDNRTALARYRQALALAELVGDERWAAAVQGNLGIAHYGLADRAAAQAHYVAALAIADRFGDLRWIGNMRSNLGLVLSDQGLHDEALVELDAALKIARQLGHVRLECFVRWNLGIVEQARGRVDVAIGHFEAARDLAASLGDLHAQEMLSTQIQDASRPPAVAC